jgi:hypothetical protein
MSAASESQKSDQGRLWHTHEAYSRQAWPAGGVDTSMQQTGASDSAPTDSTGSATVGGCRLRLGDYRHTAPHPTALL